MKRRAQGQSAPAAPVHEQPQAPPSLPPEKADRPVPATPTEKPDPSAAAAAASNLTPQPLMYGDAPPSYEDAVADDMAPINAPRPDYAPPPVAEDDILRKDEKKGWVG